MCGLARSHGPRLSGTTLAHVIAAWRTRLRICQVVRTERISPVQVTGPSGRPGAALIGVVYDTESATIYHTRILTPEDVVHELLHVAHPAWSEVEVVRETEHRWRERTLRPPSRRRADLLARVA
jgi:hypothetical protein